MPAEGALRDGGGTGFHLIETMRWQPGEGLLRGGLHLARLERSARALGFAFERAAVEESLRLDAREPLRVRLALERDGRCTVETQPFAPLAGGTVWRVAIAATRLDATDPLLRHKTSLRERYERARAEFSRDEVDEVLLTNGEGQVCEGAITSLFAEGEGGVLLTPPLGCGLLAGVLREEMLTAGAAREQVLSPADLFRSRRLFVGNSLRGLIPARPIGQEPR